MLRRGQVFEIADEPLDDQAASAPSRDRTDETDIGAPPPLAAGSPAGRRSTTVGAVLVGVGIALGLGTLRGGAVSGVAHAPSESTAARPALAPRRPPTAPQPVNRELPPARMRIRSRDSGRAAAPRAESSLPAVPIAHDVREPAKVAPLPHVVTRSLAPILPAIHDQTIRPRGGEFTFER